MPRHGLGSLVVVLLAVLLAVAVARWSGPPPAERRAVGGAGPRRGPARMAVIDALNVTHWLEPHETISAAAVAAMVDRTAPTLAKVFPDRLIYVVKDRDTVFNDEEARAIYRAAADRNRAVVAMVERYRDPPGPQNGTASHSAQGRDDLYMGVLAHRYRAPVVTADRFRDFGEFRAAVPPFHVLEFAHWREGPPHREYVRPSSTAYARLRAPRTIHPREFFP